MQVCWMQQSLHVTQLSQLWCTQMLCYSKGPVYEGLVNSALCNARMLLGPLVVRNHEFSFEVSVVQHRQRYASYAFTRSIPPPKHAQLSRAIAAAEVAANGPSHSHAHLNSIETLTAIWLASGRCMTHRVPERPPRQPAPCMLSRVAQPCRTIASAGH